MQKINDFLFGATGFVALIFIDLMPIGSLLNGVASLAIAAVTVYKLLYPVVKDKKEIKK